MLTFDRAILERNLPDFSLEILEFLCFPVLLDLLVHIRNNRVYKGFLVIASFDRAAVTFSELAQVGDDFLNLRVFEMLKQELLAVVSSVGEQNILHELDIRRRSFDIAKNHLHRVFVYFRFRDDLSANCFPTPTCRSTKSSFVHGQLTMAQLNGASNDDFSPELTMKLQQSINVSQVLVEIC